MPASTQAGAGRTRKTVNVLAITALLATSGYLTVALRKDERAKAPVVQAVTDKPVLSSSTVGAQGAQTWERLTGPDRSVLRDAKGQVLGTFTDGARTATLTGPSRTFSEPANTKSRVVTENWVRLMPQKWKAGAEKSAWFMGSLK